MPCQRVDVLRAYQLFVSLAGILTDVMDVPTGGHRRRFLTEQKVAAVAQQNKAVESTAGSCTTYGLLFDTEASANGMD